MEVQDAEAVEEEIPWNWETEVRVDVEPVFIAVSSRSREAALLRSSASFCWTCARASDKSISTFLIRAEKCEVVEIYKKGKLKFYGKLGVHDLYSILTSIKIQKWLILPKSFGN